MRSTCLVIVSALALLAASVGSAPQPVAAAADVVPPVGAPGATFAFFADGYGPEEKISFWANRPDGSVLGDPSYTARAGSSGRADWTWTAPADAPLGRWVLVVYGQASGRQQLIPFQVGDPAAPPPPSETQPIAMTPAGGPPGTLLTFYATGFDNQETVGFWATAPDHRVVGSSAYRVFSNRAGRADWSWRIPEGAQPGVWTMTAQGEDSKVKQTIRFEVR